MQAFYSQSGEDRILASIFGGKIGACLEVGAHDGVHFSNTYHFEQLGWRCILVEPNGELCHRIRKCRNASLFECAASQESGEARLYLGIGGDDVYSSLEASAQTDHNRQYKSISVTTRTIDSMLAETDLNQLDFVTIDVEGHEMQALRGFSLGRWKPRIVLLEDNSDSSSTHVEDYMQRVGYFRFWRSGANDWFALASERRIGLLFRILLSGCFSWRDFLKGTLPKAYLRWLLLTKRVVLARIRHCST